MQSASITLSAPALDAAFPASGEGATPPEGAGADDFRVLDERDEWLEFSRPAGAQANPEGAHAQTDQDSHCWESTVVFEGMHCAACAVTIEQALRATPGVREAQVNSASHHGRVVWDDTITRPSVWMGAVLATGYQPVPAHDPRATERRHAETRQMMWRCGVAGLCMMQVMMYAVPAYSTAPGVIAPDLLHLLRWAQWLLSVPVMLFSCKPFFHNAWRDLRLRRVSMDLPVALGMGVTFVVSTLGTFEPQGPFGREVYFDSLTMFVFFLLSGRWLELRLRDRTAGALEELMHRLPESVQRLSTAGESAGQWERVSARRVRVGDTVRVLPGEIFPADGVLISGSTLVNEALLTGESTPLPRQAGNTAEAAVVAGSHNLAAPVEMRVRQVGVDTRYGQIVALMEQALVSKPAIALLADRWAKPFLIFVLLAAALSCLWWWHINPERAVMIAVAVLVVTCPCALSLATPAAMLASAGALARGGVLVRRLSALEALTRVDTVVFDKTGTLTRDAFALERIELRPGADRARVLAWAGQLAGASLHPVSRALAGAAEIEQSLHVLGVEDQVRVIGEHSGSGVTGAVAGAGELRLGSAVFTGATGHAVPGLAAYLADGAGWLATFCLKEDVRTDAAAAIRQLHAQGARVCVYSGDQPEAVARLGREVGADEAHGGFKPDGKLAALRALQHAGHRVAMVGDGLNDAPILAGADVSFAFGRAAPIARSRADFVVLTDHLRIIPGVLAQSRRTLRVVRQNLAWAVIYNIVAVPLAILGYMPAWAAGLGMAVSSLLVVLNALRLASGATLPSQADRQTQPGNVMLETLPINAKVA
ncbi:MAG: cation-translocating P-type ATPase [Burkholderiaceae bacterium]|jgi:Cu2+-exporting ATPase|nr:cation-translocating P-type ATPase [Burkholderiaceae bacterium]